MMEVACVTGEGSIQMNIQELSTCTHYNTPVKIINLRNNLPGYGQAVAGHAVRGPLFACPMKRTLPDFVKLMEAYGHVGMVVESSPISMRAMERSLCHEGSYWCFSMSSSIPWSTCIPCTSRPNGSMKDMWLSKNERT